MCIATCKSTGLPVTILSVSGPWVHVQYSAGRSAHVYWCELNVPHRCAEHSAHYPESFQRKCDHANA